MPDHEISDRDAAISATVARRMMREDRLEAEREARNAPTTREMIASILFVAITSIGLLITMMAMQ
jgi:hypothetical protein